MGRPRGSKNKVKKENDGRGGARPGAGRKPKADEIKLIERLDSVVHSDIALIKLKELILKGDFKAIQLYLNYRWGKPQDHLDVTTNGNDTSFSLPIIKFFSSDEDDE